MQQFNAILLTPNSATGNAAGRPLSAAEETDIELDSRAAQKFASHLNKLTEHLEERRADGDAPGKKSDKQAVSEFAKTMLLSVDDEQVSADDAWLSMVEELNSVAEGDVSLAQVSSRHGVDVSALEAQLDEALAEFDGDIQALIAELQHVASGNALPPAGEAENQVSLSERSPLQEVLRKLDGGADIKDLLTQVETLSSQEQADFAANVEELVIQLTQLKLLRGDAEPGESLAVTSPLLATGPQVVESNIADLEMLSVTLRDQLHSLLAEDSALNELEREHVQQQLTLLEQFVNVSLANSIGAQQSAEEVADSVNIDDGDINELLSALQTLFVAVQRDSNPQSTGEESTAWLQQVDMHQLEAELNRILNQLDQELGGVDRSELLATLEVQLSTLSAQNKGSSAGTENGNPSVQLEQIRALLTELNHKLELIQADTRIVDGSRLGESGSGLPPVAHALSMASQQLRGQLQQAVQAQQSGGVASDEDFEGEFDSVRRLVSETGLNSADQRNPANTSQLGSSFQSALQGSQGGSQQGSVISREAALQRSAEGPTPSGFEAARQAQQAIDILGSGASERLRERVSVMFNSRTQAAEMRLDPPDLGRLSIRLNMNQEQASVSFQVTTPQAREALEQNLPRLRELLAEQGIMLADANISEEKQSNSEQAGAGQAQNGRTGDDGLAEGDGDSEVELEVRSPGMVSDGRVDYFV